jgi:cytochrome c553
MLLALAVSLGAAPACAQNLNLCSACHGADGNSTSFGVPSIAGQPKMFIEQQLRLFRDERRESDQMYAAARRLKDEEIVSLAGHFAGMPARSAAAGPQAPGLLESGARLATQQRCAACHGADFGGENQAPRLAGQREEYLFSEMQAYRDNRRVGVDAAMASALRGMQDDALKALAHYLSRAPLKH